MTQTSRIILVFLIVIGVAVGGIFLFSQIQRGETPVGVVSTSTPSPNAASASEAERVAEALQRLASDPTSLMANGVDAMVEGTADQAIPVGATVEVDETSWLPDGLDGGTIVTTITGSDGAEHSYLVVMVEEEDGWKVLATFPIEGAP